MIFICKKCGQKHDLEPSVVKRLKGKMTCKACGTVFSTDRSAKKPMPAQTAIRPSDKNTRAAARSGSSLNDPAKKAASGDRDGNKFRIGFGLRGKLLIFFLIPLVLALSVGGAFTLRQMDTLGKAMTNESLNMLIRVSEKEVMEYSKAVAGQLQIYLSGHKDLKKEDFNNDFEFKKIAVQRINLTMRGYTSLYEATEDGKMIFLAHVNPKYVGQDVSSLKNLIGEGFDQFTRIIRVARGGIETTGYYVQDTEGRPRDNYLVCTPVKETPYYVACMTYLDESTLGVVAIPMSPEFKNYLDLMVWPQDNEWWKPKK